MPPPSPETARRGQCYNDIDIFNSEAFRQGGSEFGKMFPTDFFDPFSMGVIVALHQSFSLRTRRIGFRYVAGRLAGYCRKGNQGLGVRVGVAEAVGGM